MKAVRIHEHGSEDVLQIEDIEVPKPAADEVLVKIQSAALNHLDIWMRKGIREIPLPLIMGSDGSGTIEETGALVKRNGRWKPGDDVVLVPFRSCGYCAYCLSGEENLCREYRIPGENMDGLQVEYITVPETYILPKPEALSFGEAAAFPLATLTAYHMLVRKTRLHPGDRVLVYGASSGVGGAAIQIAKLYGCEVISTIGSESKRSPALDLGADHVINYNEEPVGRTVLSLTDGAGVDVVFEHTGASTWPDSLRSLKRGGRIITCGATTGPHVRIDLRSLFIKHQQLIGSTMGTRRDLVDIVRLFGQNKLKVIIDRTFPLEEIREAHTWLENAHRFGKVVLHF